MTAGWPACARLTATRHHGGTAWLRGVPPAKAPPGRGVKFSLLYMGTSKWRQVQPFTSQRDDVARTIVTLWTKAGNFSFLAADLENGPILAPEYGFFVRRTSGWSVAGDLLGRPLDVGLAGRQRPGIHQGTPGQETEHHPPADPGPRGTDLGGRRHAGCAATTCRPTPNRRRDRNRPCRSRFRRND